MRRWGLLGVLILAGCHPHDAANPPQPLALHTRQDPARPFDSQTWKLERIPSYRDTTIGVRASMADDVLRRMKPGTRLSDLMIQLDEPNRAEVKGDATPGDQAFFGAKGKMLLSYPVVVDDAKHSHEDLEFLFDEDGLLLASRRIKLAGGIRLGP